MGPPKRKKGGEGKIPATPQKNALPAIYQPEPSPATEMATLIIARRYRLNLSVARLICELADIGRAEA